MATSQQRPHTQQPTLFDLDRPPEKGRTRSHVGVPAPLVHPDPALLERVGLADQPLIWRRSKVYPWLYAISDQAHCLRLPAESDGLGGYRNGFLLTPAPHNSGYLRVQLQNNGVRKAILLHQLVAYAFHGDPPGPVGTHSHEWTVDHKDGDASNNRAENLEWVTHAENLRRAHQGSRNWNATLDEEKARAIRYRYAFGEKTQQEFADEYGVSAPTIHAALYGRTWKDAGGPL